jgi:pantetheine-phosphate adenylyltransferase
MTPTAQRLAIYPGTFDPFTNGHLDIVERSIKLFDGLVVAVAINPGKKPLFSVEERIALIKASLPESFQNVTVESFEGLLVDYVERRRGAVIIRGLRAVSDFEYELQMALVNRRLKPHVDTIFKMPSEEYSFLTSTAVKEIVSLGGSVCGLVPVVVERALRKKFGRPEA